MRRRLLWWMRGGNEEMMEFIVQYWLQVLFGLITAGIGLVVKWVISLRNEQKIMHEALLAMLHDRLYQGCRYYIKKGSISDSDMKNMEYLYNGYHSLGGNGTGTELFERVKNLELKGED